MLFSSPLFLPPLSLSLELRGVSRERWKPQSFQRRGSCSYHLREGDPGARRRLRALHPRLDSSLPWTGNGGDGSEVPQGNKRGLVTPFFWGLGVFPPRTIQPVFSLTSPLLELMGWIPMGRSHEHSLEIDSRTSQNLGNSWQQRSPKHLKSRVLVYTFFAALMRYNSHSIQFIHLKSTIQWLLA